MRGDFDEDELQDFEPDPQQRVDHECDATNIAVAADGRQYCAHCGWNDPDADETASPASKEAIRTRGGTA